MNNRHDYLPRREADFLGWANSFYDQIVDVFDEVGLTQPQVDAFGVLLAAYREAFGLCQSGLTRSPSNIALKVRLRDEVTRRARALVRTIQAHEGTTAMMRERLAITVREKGRVVVPVPTDAPLVAVQDVRGRSVEIRVSDPTSTRRGKPPGVRVMRVETFVGAAPPVDPAMWTNALVSGRTKVWVDFSYDLVPGTRVWIRAAWMNGRMEAGPMSEAVSMSFGGSLSVGSTGKPVSMIAA